MTEIIEFETSRLRLRQWRAADFPAFAEMNADTDVMKYYPDILSTSDSDVLAHKFKSFISDRGWGFWAVEIIESKKFIGFVGLNEPTYSLPVSPCMEIGWRIAKEYWGNGYATEAAREVLALALDRLGMPEVYSFTPVSNEKSMAVMERIGMINTMLNFDHPVVPKNSSLREHVLYKADKEDWMVGEV